MFSSEQALRLGLYGMRGWTLWLKCGRCRRVASLDLSRFVRLHNRVLGDVVSRARCGECREKPAAAMLTNDTSYVAPSRVVFIGRDPKKGPLYVVLWAQR